MCNCALNSQLCDPILASGELRLYYAVPFSTTGPLFANAEDIHYTCTGYKHNILLSNFANKKRKNTFSIFIITSHCTYLQSSVSPTMRSSPH